MVAPYAAPARIVPGVTALDNHTGCSTLGSDPLIPARVNSLRSPASPVVRFKPFGQLELREQFECCWWRARLHRVKQILAEWDYKIVAGVTLAVVGIWWFWSAVAGLLLNLKAILDTKRKLSKVTTQIVAFSALLSMALVAQVGLPLCYRYLAKSKSHEEVLIARGHQQLAAGKLRLDQLKQLLRDTTAERRRIELRITSRPDTSESPHEQSFCASN